MSEPDGTKKLHKPEPEAVTEWFLKTGFPLEMRVARTLKAEGMGAAISAYYENEGGVHEADVLAWRGRRGLGGTKRDLTVYLCCECMDSSKPWLVLAQKNDPELNEYLVKCHPVSAAGQKVLEQAAKAVNDELTIFRPNEVTGYGAVLTQVGNEGQQEKDGNVAFKKLVQAVAGAEAQVARRKGQDDPEGPIVVALPVIVLGGALYVAYLDEQGKPTLRATDNERIFWRRTASAPGERVVYVVREDFLPTFAKRATRAFEQISRVTASVY